MNHAGSLLDELRVRYEALPESTDDRGDVESFEAIDGRMRRAFRWLEQAITYLNGLKPTIEHKFDLGYGYVFDSPWFAHGSVGQHERRIVGFPVLEGIDVYYEISAAKALSIEVIPGWVSFAEKTLDAFGLQYTCSRIEESDGNASQLHLFRPTCDPGTRLIWCRLSDGDRHCGPGQRRSPRARHAGISEHRDRGADLEDLVRLILGRDSAFLKRGRLAGLRGRAPEARARYAAESQASIDMVRRHG